MLQDIDSKPLLGRVVGRISVGMSGEYLLYRLCRILLILACRLDVEGCSHGGAQCDHAQNAAKVRDSLAALQKNR